MYIINDFKACAAELYIDSPRKPQDGAVELKKNCVEVGHRNRRKWMAGSIPCGEFHQHCSLVRAGQA